MDTEPQPSPDNQVISGSDQPSAPIPKRKKMIMMAVVGVVLVGGIVAVTVLLNKPGSQTSKSLVPINDTVAHVGIAKTGFLPQTINISKGQEITWTNNDSAPHRITADQDKLASFGSIDPLNTGDSYTYVFENTGTYHYYDPQDPKGFVGTITVK